MFYLVFVVFIGEFVYFGLWDFVFVFEIMLLKKRNLELCHYIIYFVRSFLLIDLFI